MGFSQEWDFVKQCCVEGRRITVVVDGQKITGTFVALHKNKLVRMLVPSKDDYAEESITVTFEITKVSAYGIGEW